MRVWLRLSWLSLLAFAVTIGCASSGPTATKEGGSVLLISVDGLVPADLSAFGGEIETPALAALMARGQAWSQARTAAPMTRPAVASLLTGVAPDRHGVRDDIFTSLDTTIPTLAEGFQGAGYQTAGFPDTAFLAETSGLWRGFDLVNSPPPMRIDVLRWIPIVLSEDDQVGAFEAWMAAKSDDTPWFGWVHLSRPIIGQLKQMFTLAGENDKAAEAAQEYAEAIAIFDRQLGRILAAAGEEVSVILVGTQGDQRGGENESPGLGFSVADRAVHVPVVVAPAGQNVERGSDQPVWSLDVPATLADWGGFAAGEQAEGISLSSPAPEARVTFSWSWAPLDQAGWLPLQRADAGAETTIRGLNEPAPASAALDSRATPSRLLISEENSQRLLELAEIEATPIPEGGYLFEDLAERAAVGQILWRARGQYHRNSVDRAGQMLATLSRRRDTKNVASFLDRGQTTALMGLQRATRIMTDAVKLRPRDVDVWHWYAHAIWSEGGERPEQVLETILPHVSAKDRGDVLYDLACARSLAGDADKSAEYLEAAWKAGFRDSNHMEADADLRHLRESGKFSEVMRRVQ